MTIREAGRRLRDREISAVELVRDSLQAVERDAALNAFITVTGDQALRSAHELDQELQEGKDRGPLHGIPIAFKDLYYTRGVRSTNGSQLFADFVPEDDATVVQRLQTAGAISVGKLNQHELAYGISSSNPWFGPVRNPWDPECIPGGSSGGSGAAVATGSIFVGMGSDTGGSIRNPSAFCGTVGMKPTFGRVSRCGCFQLGLTLDTMGPLTRTVEDAAIVMNAITGFDPQDDATVLRPEEHFVPADNVSLKGVRLGVPNNFYLERLHPDVEALYNSAMREAERLGAEIIHVDVPDPEGLNLIGRTTLLGEAAAVMRPFLHRRDEIGADVRTLLDQGTLLSASDYINAQRVRRAMMADWHAMFDKIDVLVTPSAPVPAPQIGQQTVTVGGQEEDTRLLSTKFVRGVNVIGLPALALPCGLTRERMPAGLQLIGSAWSEKRLFACGKALEQALPQVRL
ncbi:MAG: amidase [Bryobacteraceae bacterium]|nr:amidase [Bryobacteraceae bacterium]